MIRTAFVSVMVFVVFSTCVSAQEFRVGGGLGYGSQINTLGINFRGEARFDEQWSITPHFNLFFNNDQGIIINQWRAFNIDFHYFFPIAQDDQSWVFYPLIGLNVATVSEKVNSIHFSNTYAGLNLGLGTDYQINEQLSGFGEIKYVISNADQAVITVGVLYRLSK